MATDAPITGAPTRAPSFSDFDLSRLDTLAGDLDTLKSLIWVAVDLIHADRAHGENLLHAALTLHQQVDTQLGVIHRDLNSAKDGNRG